ncbi:hydrogen peroxide-inducible genes activator [Aquamicrobium terrae]|uniref:LysR family hydrogen peroxide-inducible transcriptional activator n=1 Tax=Aquamicrobium terrae TaxID=1324945 RepID=A0ABV2N4I2_9HYPH
MIKFTIRQMEYFEALADTQHFGRAAALAGISQPALSAQIAELETRLGVRLFERGGRTAPLTEDARALKPRIDHILSELRAIEATAQRGRPTMEGQFRLGVIPTVAPYLLPRMLPPLRNRFPAFTLELREAVTATLVEETATGRLDAIIAALPLDHPAIMVEPLFEDRFFLAVSVADPAFASPPVPPDNPALERLMLLEEGHCMRDQALAVCDRVRTTAISNYGATSLTTLLQMVAHGQGVTLIPELACSASQAIPELKVVPFAEPAPFRTLGLAWRKSSSRVRECQTLAEIIREVSISAPQLDHPS